MSISYIKEKRLPFGHTRNDSYLLWEQATNLGVSESFVNVDKRMLSSKIRLSHMKILLPENILVPPRFYLTKFDAIKSRPLFFF